MRADTLDKIAAASNAAGLDAIIAMSPENFAYLAGNRLLPPYRPATRHLMVVARPDGETVLFVPETEAPEAARAVPGVAAATWADGEETAMESLAGALWDMSLSGARVGIETDHLAASDLLALGAALPRAEFVPAEGLFARARAIKTGREIELMRRTAGMADEAAAAALAMCRAGIAEFEIAAEITRSLYRRGAEGISSLMVASGPPGSRMTPVPGGRVLERGDEVRIELAPHLEGYHATVRRTGFVGRTARGGATGTRAAQAWSSLAGMIGPGAAGRDIARAHLKAIAPFEAPPKVTLGHGIGLGPREPPLLGAGGAAVLEEGMVLVLEPLVHDRRRGFDLPAKEMVLVTASGAENLTAERAGMPEPEAENG